MHPWALFFVVVVVVLSSPLSVPNTYSYKCPSQSFLSLFLTAPPSSINGWRTFTGSQFTKRCLFGVLSAFLWCWHRTGENDLINCMNPITRLFLLTWVRTFTSHFLFPLCSLQLIPVFHSQLWKVLNRIRSAVWPVRNDFLHQVKNRSDLYGDGEKLAFIKTGHRKRM